MHVHFSGWIIKVFLFCVTLKRLVLMRVIIKGFIPDLSPGEPQPEYASLLAVVSIAGSRRDASKQTLQPRSAHRQTWSPEDLPTGRP